jgi:ADP-L-glycero-D-manno-heptose 6-epimerase
MASLVFKHFHDYRERGYVNLFEGSHGLSPGEQARDFIYVDDVIAVNLFFLRNSGVSGIYNVGTSQSASFNELTEATLNAVFAHHKKPRMVLNDMIASNLIRYIPFPQHLLSQYQPFTKADITRLRKSGYTESFMPLSLGAESYIHYLTNKYH